MDIWIIRDGEKSGPIHDFEVRRKIENGELAPSTPAWHEGLSSWKPLAEIDLFTREFELAETAPPPSEPTPLPSENSPENHHPTSPNRVPKTCYGRRFLARWFDLTFYSGLWWIGMWAAKQDIQAALFNPWIMFFHYIPWFALETLLIHRWGTTPGKWLLSLDVTNRDGSRLDLAAATRRSVRILFTGVGFGWGLLAVFCQALSLFTAKRLGSPLWDHSGGHTVNPGQLRPRRVASWVFLLMIALQLQVIVISPYLFEMAGDSFPALKAEYEKNLPWHLPKRSKPN